MKKLLVVLMVLSMVTIANAGLVIGVNGEANPQGTVELMPSDTAVISVVGLGIGNTPNVDAWLVIQGLGSATGGVMLYPGDVAFMTQFVAPDESGTLDWLASVGYASNNAYYLSFGDSQARPVDGVVVGDILFHCDGAPGDVTITLVNIFDDGSGAVINVLDTQIIKQVPEPITMTLLGLGGLFLRRRK